METLDRIGLAIIGCGTIGRIRAKLARQYPGVDWLGLCDVSKERGQALANEFSVSRPFVQSSSSREASEISASSSSGLTPTFPIWV